ncbi:zinc ribbon domain-containing protein [Ktedonobacter sp. SOSP1-52]|uniref:zinc ribbon domain-containing protein n=1 Tax=Ktedonobacter sp. SOSP1-52 TaxID=2778366 RepID=UPI001915C80C|nr:zinc ribbon domain-containing protein [Ktedonobacter sp. SOSP1-52]
MSRCIYCGAENPEDARFCGRCGRSGQDEQNITATERHEPAEGEQTLILPEGLASKAQVKSAERHEEPPLEGAIPPIGIGASGQGSTQVPDAPGTPQAPQVTSAPARRVRLSPSLTPPRSSRPTRTPHRAHLQPLNRRRVHLTRAQLPTRRLSIRERPTPRPGKPPRSIPWFIPPLKEGLAQRPK